MSGQKLDKESLGDSAGLLLAQARESVGITQREVSDALHLPITTVVAIESDDTENLPAPVFTRGYIRAYAKLLELDPEPLMATLAGEAPAAANAGVAAEDSAESASASAAKLSLSTLAINKSQLLAGAVGVVVLVGGLIWAFSGSDADLGANPETEVPVAAIEQETSPQAQLAAATPEPAAPEAAAEQPTSANVQSSVSEPIQTEAAEVASAIASADVQPGDVQPEDVQASQAVELADTPASGIDGDSVASPPSSASVAAPTAVVNAAAGELRTRRLTPAGDDRLNMEFTEECWVEVKNTAGSLLFGDLGRAGQRLELVGSGPFRVLLGYAPGVLLKFNAEPVALSPHTRNNVASLVLGQ